MIRQPGRFLVVAVAGWLVGEAALAQPPEKPAAPRAPAAWTLDEALQHLRANPHDAYVQFVAWQLGRQEDRLDEVRSQFESWQRDFGRRPDPNRRGDVDLFSIFAGALAVQESLQLDTLQRLGEPTDQQQAAPPVALNTLVGPQVKSHPWEKMLGDRLPEVSPLSKCIPVDQWMVNFRSLNALLEVMETSEWWLAHLTKQSSLSAQAMPSPGRFQAQLALATDPLTRPFYDLVVDEVALTGSDLYLREGSDVTALFRFKPTGQFEARMDQYLTQFEKAVAGAKRETGEYNGVKYVHLTSPERQVHVFAAYPRPDVHVRSNSQAAFCRVIDAMQGAAPDGTPVVRLGDTVEFRYIRAILPDDPQLEDGLVYLSDPFIRRITGPQVKLAELRRLVCYNHLRMIGHAACLHRTQTGRPPKDLADLVASGCAPAEFGKNELTCPEGGSYALSADGWHGVCSRHGHALNMTPCCELPIEEVTAQEAEAYRAFVEQYESYWRTFFDPIVIRVKITPQRYRLETVVLPLIDNTLYTGLAAALGGPTEPLDALPVPPRNIFSLNVKLNKEPLLKSAEEASRQFNRDLADFLNTREPIQLDPSAFLQRGIGNQIGLHAYDGKPLFDFNLTGFLGQTMGSFGGVRRFDGEMLPIAFLVASLNSPVYISVPVEDAEVVDEFLGQLDRVLGAHGHLRGDAFFEVGYDFYKMPLEGTTQQIRVQAVSLGPLRWRFYWTRIENGLYIASTKEILEDLRQAHLARSQAPAQNVRLGPTGHAMVRVRATNWQQVLPHFQLGWAEANRQACAKNVVTLSAIARALAAEDLAAAANGPTRSPQQNTLLARRGSEVHGCRFYCPDGGRYVLSPDGKGCRCAYHGVPAEPFQLPAPAPRGPLGQAMRQFAGATATLSFLEDGLHAVLTIERSP